MKASLSFSGGPPIFLLNEKQLSPFDFFFDTLEAEANITHYCIVKTKYGLTE